jgi:hypothetical protein
VQDLESLARDYEILPVRKGLVVRNSSTIRVRRMGVDWGFCLAAYCVQSSHVIPVPVGDKDGRDRLLEAGEDLLRFGPGVHDQVAFWSVHDEGIDLETAHVEGDPLYLDHEKLLA